MRTRRRGNRGSWGTSYPGVRYLEVAKTVLWGVSGLGLGLLLGWRAPVVVWPLALGAVGLWLGLWPRPGLGLLALTFGLILTSPFTGRPEQTRAPQLWTVFSTPEQASSWAGARELRVRNGEGDVTVAGGGPWRFRVHYRAGAEVRGVPETLLTALRGRTLDVTGLEPSWSQEPLRGATALVRARVPRRTQVSVRGRSGDVVVAGVASARVDINLGDVTLSRVSGLGSVQTDVGNVSVTEVGGAQLSTQVGDIWLEPRSGSAPVLAKADVGNIALVLPPGANARILATSVSRELPRGFRRTSPTRAELVLGSGERLIVLETRVGRIRLLRR